MRKLLARLPDNVLYELASNFSLQHESREKMINDLIDYFKAYRLTVADVKARYPNLAEYS